MNDGDSRRLFSGATTPSQGRIAGLGAAWVALVVRRRWWVVGLALLLSVAALWDTTQRLGINTDTADMLSPELPFRRAIDRLEEHFPQDFRTLLVVVEGQDGGAVTAVADALTTKLAAEPAVFSDVFWAAGDPFFRRNGLLFLEPAQLEALAAQLADAQPFLAAVAADPSARGVADILVRAFNAAADGLAPLPDAFRPMIDAIAQAAENAAAGRRAPIDWADRLASATGAGTAEGHDRRQIILLELRPDYASLQPAAAAVATIDRTVAGLDPALLRGVQIGVTGEPVMRDEELKSVRDNIGVVGAISMALVLAILVPGLGSFRLFIATTVTLICGLIWTAWVASITVGTLNLISVAFAVLFIGLSVDFGIHFCLRYRENIPRTVGPGEALAAGAASVVGGMLLATVAATIGFLSFAPTAYRGLAELGVISSCGMVVALLANLTVLPALLAINPLPANARDRGISLGHVVPGISRRRPRLVLAVVAAIVLPAAALLPWVHFDDDPFNLRDAHNPSVRLMLHLMDDPLVGTYRASSIVADAKAAAALAERYRALPEVEQVITAADLVPADQPEKLAVIGDMALFLGPALSPGSTRPAPTPEEQRAALAALQTAAARVDGGEARRLAAAIGAVLASGAAPTFEANLIGGLPRLIHDLRTSLEAGPVTAGDLPASIRRHYVAENGEQLVVVLPKGNARDREVRVRFVRALQQVDPAVTGEVVVITEAGNAVIRAFVEAGLTSFAAIVVLLLVVLRRVIDAGIVIAPLLVASTLMAAATVLIPLPFNFANVIALPLLFGLGVASGIYMVLRARAEAAGGTAVADTSTPRAVLFSALTTMGSFCSLAISSHPGTATIGVLLTLAIGLNTILTLFIVPALCRIGGLSAIVGPRS